ncbi:uncharacterized protein LOC101221727 [Cucumis sativus]|uniref:uncharacterized protein LOC101221727 n=1 Tax=Cucumis sativus TaxID=3659 RepID=UPI0002B46DC6|nr:uncharacterized protein LOC101221727 [Cucumis sativus]KAE8652886.1 hypothetical protein Csa_017664 [Cucumis sativus]
MEGVGARLGRSSTRYGPATVFTGPVRKWKKKWIHVAPSTTASNNHSHSQRHTNPNNVTANATANSSTNASHLLLFKWTPITQSLNNGNADEKNAGKEDTPTVTEEPPRRKFKYMPIAVLEEQKNEAAENEATDNVEDEALESDDVEPSSTVATKGELQDEKPDINDVPMEESQSQDNDRPVRQDLNESTLDLSLNLNALDDGGEASSKADHIRDGKRKG